MVGAWRARYCSKEWAQGCCKVGVGLTRLGLRTTLPLDRDPNEQTEPSRAGPSSSRPESNRLEPRRARVASSRDQPKVNQLESERRDRTRKVRSSCVAQRESNGPQPPATDG